MILKMREGGSGSGTVRRVEAERGMTMKGIGGDGQSELFHGGELRWNVLE